MDKTRVIYSSNIIFFICELNTFELYQMIFGQLAIKLPTSMK